MSHWRVVVHALDRTGPPVLARAWLRWLRDEHPEHTVDVVAVRGGPLEGELSELYPVRVLLDPHAPGVPDHDEGRAAVARRLDGLLDADATLLVSVAAGQALPVLAGSGPVVTWSVEAGEDLHWLDRPIGLLDRTDRWLAGSEVTAADLSRHLGEAVEVHLVPEFIELPRATGPNRQRYLRSQLGASDGDLLVAGAGIATWRKAPDLFLEVAVAHGRLDPAPTRYTWIGGSTDELHPLVSAEGRRVAPGLVRFVPPVPDIDAHLAAADVLAHTARLDSFPLVCLHAAAVGTPVVAFEDCGGVQEMFGDAFVGVPYPDLSAFARTVEELRDPTRRAEVADAQRARVLARFTSGSAASLVLEHLQDAAARVQPKVGT